MWKEPWFSSAPDRQLSELWCRLRTTKSASTSVIRQTDWLRKLTFSSTDVKIGDEIEVEVVKVNDGEGNVVLSQRNIVNRKSWDEIVAKQEAGEFVVGIGKEAVKGGLLADVAGVRTFIPASQLSMRYVEKIGEFVGQEMRLKIIEIDKAKKRIVASRKAVLITEEADKKKNVWEDLKAKEGEVIKGTVRRLADFGAFVDIGGVDGLVHVTDLSWGRVHHPSEVVSIGDVIEVKVLKVEPERERVSLSYKQTRPRPWTVAAEKYPVGAVVEGKVVRITTFGAFVELEPRAGRPGAHLSVRAHPHRESRRRGQRRRRRAREGAGCQHRSQAHLPLHPRSTGGRGAGRRARDGRIRHRGRQGDRRITGNARRGVIPALCFVVSLGRRDGWANLIILYRGVDNDGIPLNKFPCSRASDSC